MTRPTVGFAGMTHLGILSAGAAASKGFDTVFFDPDAARIEHLRRGELPVSEPGLDEQLRDHAACITYASHYEALAACDLVYIASDVPTDDEGQSDLGPIRTLIESVSARLGPSAVLVVLCQVPPGFTRGLAFDSARLYYQVETLVFGRAVERATQPERFILGCADPKRPLPTALCTFLASFGCPLLPMRYESAELAKISINCCLVASVTVANTLAELSERIGADWNEIAPALKLDRRIGPYAYLAPGLGLAGGNLERDLATVLRFSEATGSEAGLITAFVRNSRHRRHWVLRTLHAQLLATARNPVIAVLGLAYKENTHSVKNSPSLALIESLGSWPLRVYDPLVSAAVVTHPDVVGVPTALDAADGADAVIIMTPWPQFRDIDVNVLAARMRGKLVIDPFRTLAPSSAEAAGLRYITLGTAPYVSACGD